MLNRYLFVYAFNHFCSSHENLGLLAPLVKTFSVQDLPILLSGLNLTMTSLLLSPLDFNLLASLIETSLVKDPSLLSGEEALPPQSLRSMLTRNRGDLSLESIRLSTLFQSRIYLSFLVVSTSSTSG